MELKGRKLEINGEYEFQSLRDHILGVENRVSKYSARCDFKNTVKTIALLHDAGKAKKSWQKYLLESKGRVSHSNLGMCLSDYLFDELEIDKTARAFISDIIKYCIGAHHGLFDIINDDGENMIDKRVNREKDELENRFAIEEYYKIIDKCDLKKIIKRSVDETNNMINKIMRFDKSDRAIIPYYLAVITRVLLSMQIDADWSDAAAFEYDYEREYDYDEIFSWDSLIMEYESYIKNNFNLDTDLNRIRSQISDECFKNAQRPTGIYKLDVPTGGGKTIAAMRFALNHAKYQNKERVIYISPFISILEQNADVYRKMMTENSKYILEHHSNIVYESNKDNHIEKEAYKYFSSNWSSKIILTSMVQLLNCFFSSDKRSIRRLHRLKNSVIIIDELQSIPLKIITPFNLFINAMSEFFGVTFVLCTATQPPHERIMGAENADKKTARIKYANEKNLVMDYSKFEEFDRVEILDNTMTKSYEINDIIDLINKKVKKSDSVLLIANTRSVVDLIYTSLKDEIQTDHKIYMLSNNICPAHRLDILTELKSRLKNGMKTVLISTPLLEAGVDISFEIVIRSLTGIDSIAQAAGRCNRSGEYGRGRVLLINIDPKLENISMMEEVKTAAEVTLPILNDFKNCPQKYDGNLLSTKAIEIYFKNYHEKLSNKTHYDLKGGATLYDILNQNKYMQNKIKYNRTDDGNRRLMNQSFKTAGDGFRAIEDNSNGIIVPYKKGTEYINRLLSHSIDFNEIKEIISSCQLYTVGIYANNLEKLKELKVVTFIEDFNLYILDYSYYDMERGIVLESRGIDTFVL